MANMCLYEPMNGAYPHCNGRCRAGKKICSYYFIDPVSKVMNDWKKEAGVETPILWKRDSKRNKICLYTTRPGLFIGLHGTTYQKYHDLLKKAMPTDQYIQNGIDIIECDDGI